ncbi:MAG: hypothetical protein MUF23_01495 [Pirellula sp.]|nr:hypothetical protein [Pirellula sp.]
MPPEPTIRWLSTTLADESALPVGQAIRGAKDEMLRMDVATRMLVMWRGVDRRHRVFGSMSSAQSVDWSDRSKNKSMHPRTRLDRLLLVALLLVLGDRFVVEVFRSG